MPCSLLERCPRIDIILEIEAGVVGGEEDGVKGRRRARSSTPPPRTCSRWRGASTRSGARYLFAATFGNVHGVYKPGAVKLKPTMLRDGQEAVSSRYGEAAASRSSSTAAPARRLEEIHEAIDYGVVKMNVDTDTQYAFTRPIADHMFKNYDGVLKVDGEVGDKKAYDPRSYLATGGGRHGRARQAGGPRSAGPSGQRCCKV